MSSEAVQKLGNLESLRIPRARPPARTSRKRFVFAATLVVVLTAAGVLASALYSRTIGRPLTVQTLLVQARGHNQPRVMLTGSGYVVTRHKYITIGTKILGQILAEPIEEGQHLKEGDLLARIDDRDYQAQLRQAYAARELAEANVRLTIAKAERARKLDGTGAISKEELETAINAAEVAQAQLKRDEAAVDYAKFEVSQCVITSPINGIVLKKYREMGDTINYGGQIQAGGGATDIAQLADTDDMRAEVDINESDIAKVGIGSPAAVALDAYPDKRFDAALVKVYPEADRQKGTVKVEVQIEKPDLELIKPEMGVKVSFLANRSTATAAPMIVIPKAAIMTDGHESFVWTVQNGTLRKKPVVRARELETGAEIKGLDDGEIVVVAPTPELRVGQTVTVAGAPVR
jgi:RND family efflux transporter MFP subunit